MATYRGSGQQQAADSAAADAGDRPRPRWLVVGASGRLGRLVHAGWSLAPPPARIVAQVRTAGSIGDALLWAPLEGSGPLRAHCRDAGGFDAMVVLAGIVRERPGAAFADDARIVAACLGAAVEAGIPRALVASSAAVYGSGAQTFSEDDAVRPTTAYGAAKRASEAVCADWRRRGLAVTALRIGNVAGADALLGQRRAREAREIRLDRFADGAGPARSYIDPLTLAQVLAALAMRPDLPPTLNVAAPGAVAMADLLDAAGLQWRWTEAPASAVQRLVLDVGRLAALFDFAPDAADAARIVAAWRRVEAA